MDGAQLRGRTHKFGTAASSWLLWRDYQILRGHGCIGGDLGEQQIHREQRTACSLNSSWISNTKRRRLAKIRGIANLSTRARPASVNVPTSVRTVSFPPLMGLSQRSKHSYIGEATRIASVTSRTSGAILATVLFITWPTKYHRLRIPAMPCSMCSRRILENRTQKIGLF